jgi:hypothetical protein
MITPEAQKVLNKLNRIDLAAAEYVRQRILDGSCNHISKEHKDILASLFSWAGTPQGYNYWRDIKQKYNALPNITPKGNYL